MKTILILLLLVVVNFSRANTGNTTYLVFMRNGTQLKGAISEVKKGKYIKLVKEDGTKQTIDWDLCKGYLSVEEYNKLQAKHKDWLKCTLVIKGDTLNGKIKTRYVYDPKTGKFNFNKNTNNDEDNAIFERRTIAFASDDEQEWKLSPLNYTAFFIYTGRGLPDKYVSIQNKNDHIFDVYKVLVEGKCSLLYSETTVSNTAPVMGPNGMAMTTIVGLESTYDHYIIYYKGILTGMKTDLEDGPSIYTGFKKRCKEVFADCPALIEKINNKAYKPDDLGTMVKEFNQCIADNPSGSQQK